jgi:hypothetical protein
LALKKRLISGWDFLKELSSSQELLCNVVLFVAVAEAWAWACVCVRVRVRVRVCVNNFTYCATIATIWLC